MTADETPTSTSTDDLVTVHVTTDPVEGEMLVEMLHGEAIAARLVHVNNALLGAPAQLFQIRIEVVASQAARARELIDELAHPVDGDGPSDVAPATGDPAADEPAAPPARRILTGIGFLIPGGAHLRARRPWTAAVLEAGLVACLVILKLNRGSDFTANLAYAALFSIFICDVVGARRAVRAAAAGGAAPGRLRQVVAGVILLLVAGALGAGVAALAAVPRWRSGRALARMTVTCRGDALVFANHAEHQHTILMDEIVLMSPSPARGFHPVQVQGRSEIDVPSGGERTLPFVVEGWLSSTCLDASSSIAGRCRMGFRFRLRDAEEVYEPTRTAIGICNALWQPYMTAAPASTRLNLGAASD